MITIEQCRAARGILDWTQQDLADASGLSKTAINNFEKGHSDIKMESLRAIRVAFESAEIEFIDDCGLQRSNEQATVLKGPHAVDIILDDIHHKLKTKGGELLGLNISDRTTEHTPPQKLLEHLGLIKETACTQRIICNKDARSILSPVEHCRWLPEGMEAFTPPTFVYPGSVAIEIWGQSRWLLVKSKDAAQAEKQRFETLWTKSAQPSLDDKSKKKSAVGLRAEGA